MYKMDRNEIDFYEALNIRSKWNMPIDPLIISILSVIAQNKNIIFIKSVGQRKIGYYALAKISNESIRLVKLGRPFLPYAFEANEGKIPVICDIAFDPLFRKEALTALQIFLNSYRIFGVYRRGKLKLYTKTGCFFRKVK